MCLGIPMQVISVSETMALCRGPDGETLIDILLVTPVLPGDWLLTFHGARDPGYLRRPCGEGIGSEEEAAQGLEAGRSPR